MKIDSSSQSSPALPREIQIDRNGGSPGRTSSSPEPPSAFARIDGDATHLSHAALAVSSSASVPDVRSEKVAAVQQAIASGNYAVSPSDVAGRLIDHLLQS